MFERQKVINNSNGITADRAALFLRGPGYLSAFANRGGPMVCEHLQRGRQEIKIFLPSFLLELRHLAFCFMVRPWHLHLPLQQTQLNSSVSVTAHPAALGTCLFSDRALFYFRISVSFLQWGRHTCCPDSRGEELLSFSHLHSQKVLPHSSQLGQWGL